MALLPEELPRPLAHRLKPEMVAELAQQMGFGAFEAVPLAHTVLYRMRS